MNVYQEANEKGQVVRYKYPLVRKGFILNFAVICFEIYSLFANINSIRVVLYLIVASSYVIEQPMRTHRFEQ